MIRLFLIFTTLSFLSNIQAQQTENFTDARDGKTYKTIKIGNQVWMTENLSFKTDSGCWAFNDNSEFIAKLGYLYNWHAAMDACPVGWKLPSKNDFETLLNNLTGSDFEIHKSLMKGGSSGFSALFNGYRDSNGKFGETVSGFFWSSSPFLEEDAFYLDINNYLRKAVISPLYMNCAISVRCIRNN